MSKEMKIIREARKTVEQIQSGDLVLKTEAQNINVTTRAWKDALGRLQKDECSLTDAMGKEVANFVKVKNARLSKKDLPTVEDYVIIDLNGQNRRRLFDISCKIIDYVELARVHRVIDDVGLAKKLRQTQEENVKLKEQNASLEKLNIKLAEENTRLRKVFPDTKKVAKPEKGDLKTP